MEDKINIASLDKFDPLDSNIPITLSISDFRSLSSRKGSASKTITVPATKKNSSILGFYKNPNVSSLFDVNKRQAGFIDGGSGRILEGGIHLIKTKKVNGLYDQYELVLLGNNAEWFDLLKTKSIKDVPLGSYIFTKELVRESWALNGDTSEAVYPLIDYGAFTDAEQIGPLTIPVTVAEDYRPAVYVKQILLNMFKDIGYTVQSKFFQKQQFRDLIQPFTEENIFASDEFTALQAANVENTNVQLDVPKPLVIVQYNVGSDPGNNFSFTSNSYTTKLKGSHEINASITMHPDGFSFFARDVSIQIHVTSPGVALPQIVVGTEFTIPGGADLNGLPVPMSVNALMDLPDESVVTIRLRSTQTSPDYNIDISNAKLTVTPKKLLFSEDIEFDLASTLPDIKQSDWLRDLIARFNLFIDTDNRRKVVTIETRDDFYLDIDQAEDWTYKLDMNGDIDQNPITEGLNRTLNYTWVDDRSGDIFAKGFLDGTGSTLGDGSVTLENEYLQGAQEVVKSVFAATTMGHQFSGSLFIPAIYKDDSGEASYKFKPRLLIYEGLIPGQIAFEGELLDKFPFAYFQKKTSIPTDVSLNFRNLNDIFASPNDQYVGLIERFYGRQINQINKGRIYRPMMRLTDSDIAKLNFRTPKLIKNTYFYINKVEDYLSGGQKSTRVELIQKIN